MLMPAQIKTKLFQMRWNSFVSRGRHTSCLHVRFETMLLAHCQSSKDWHLSEGADSVTVDACTETKSAPSVASSVLAEFGGRCQKARPGTWQCVRSHSHWNQADSHSPKWARSSVTCISPTRHPLLLVAWSPLWRRQSAQQCEHHTMIHTSRTWSFLTTLPSLLQIEMSVFCLLVEFDVLYFSYLLKNAWPVCECTCWRV